jgi:hypothetical protein
LQLCFWLFCAFECNSLCGHCFRSTDSTALCLPVVLLHKCSRYIFCARCWR